MPTFHYTVDAEVQETHEHQLTPDQILSNAGLDPATHYLVEIEGSKKKSFQGKGSVEIPMHEHLVFVSVFTGPTPVS